VKIHYKHFPLDVTCNIQVGRTVHGGACDLARGGICAADSGRFWEYHDKVFARPWESALATREDVLRIGDSVGLDRARFGACLDSAPTRGRLAADIEEGWRIGVESTPTIVLNGRKLPSARNRTV
jgi:protein-disulfide isomerase